MNVSMFKTNSVKLEAPSVEAVWLSVRDTTTGEVTLFFNSVSELKAFSESLAKQVGELNG